MSVPPEAVQAARMALYGLPISTYTWEQLATAALEAAAPLIRAGERGRIARLAEKHGAHYGCYAGITTGTVTGVAGPGDGKTTVTSGLRPFDDLLREEAPSG